MSDGPALVAAAKGELWKLRFTAVPLAEARHQGWGVPLPRAAIDKAWARGLTRIHLSARADNLNAKALCEKLRFKHRGVERHAMRVDGSYHDACTMALPR